MRPEELLTEIARGNLSAAGQEASPAARALDAYVRLIRGETDGPRQACQEALTQAMRSNSPLDLGYCYSVLSKIYADAGEKAQAQTAVCRALEHADASDDPVLECFAALTAAQVALKIGSPEDVAQALDRARGRVKAFAFLKSVLDLIEAEVARRAPAFSNLAFETIIESREGRQALALVDTITAETEDVVEMLNRSVELLTRAVGAQRGFILLLDDRDEIEYRAVWQIQPDEEGRASRGVVDMMRHSRRSLVIQNTHSESALANRESILTLGPRAVLCSPILHRGRVAGAIYLDGEPGTKTFTRADVELVEIFARKIGRELVLSRLVRRQSAEIERLRTQLARRYTFESMIGKCARMQEIFELIRKVAPTNYPVLLVGETGTGKELTARAIHGSSPRRDGPFLAVNCGALPETLLDSELFGHVKGSFTGADRDAPGLFESASGGTLFLDEIEAMSPAMQVKLLRVLEESVVTRVGARQPVRVDVRVISASNEDLQELVRERRFREDLYHRLKVITIELPPLRERFEDLPLLVEHLLERVRRELGKPELRVDPQVLEVFARYSWPGNIRELENELRRLAIACGEIITVDAVSREIRQGDLAAPAPGLEGKVSDVERKEILEALEKNNWNIQRAAEALSMNRVTLSRRIRKYGIQMPK